MEEELKASILAGSKIQQEGQVTIGFFEGKGPFGDGRDRNSLQAFAVKGRLRVQFTVVTYLRGNEGEPFAEKAERDRLVELTKERINHIDTESWRLNKRRFLGPFSTDGDRETIIAHCYSLLP